MLKRFSDDDDDNDDDNDDDKKCHKVRDHCHFTRKYREPLIIFVI